jgi:hypothetical protein
MRPAGRSEEGNDEIPVRARVAERQEHRPHRQVDAQPGGIAIDEARHDPQRGVLRERDDAGRVGYERSEVPQQRALHDREGEEHAAPRGRGPRELLAAAGAAALGRRPLEAAAAPAARDPELSARGPVEEGSRRLEARIGDRELAHSRLSTSVLAIAPV